MSSIPIIPLTPSRADRTRFKTLLREAGIFEALRFLNSRSAHRFTALYIFDGPALRNVCLVDKTNNSVRQMEAIQVTDSYCLFVRDSGQKFIIPNSLDDGRVDGHPKRETIRSYCGLPLINDKASIVGTICHFDFVPVAYEDKEVQLLEAIASEASELVDTLEQAGFLKTNIV